MNTQFKIYLICCAIMNCQANAIFKNSAEASSSFDYIFRTTFKKNQNAPLNLTSMKQYFKDLDDFIGKENIDLREALVEIKIAFNKTSIAIIDTYLLNTRYASYTSEQKQEVIKTAISYTKESLKALKTARSVLNKPKVYIFSIQKSTLLRHIISAFEKNTKKSLDQLSSYSTTLNGI